LVLGVAHSSLSNGEYLQLINQKLASARLRFGDREACLLSDVLDACGELSGLFRLIWEAVKRVQKISSAIQTYYFRRRVPDALVRRFRNEVGSIVCLPGFQGVSLSTGLEMSGRALKGMKEVLFEVEDVRLLPVMRSVGRGFTVVRGRGY
jgi:hypothetical protein